MHATYALTTRAGTRFTYRRHGKGAALVCVPGGPLLSSEYLGDLGGLDGHVELVLFDPPGSDNNAAADASDYRCDRVAENLETLRLHLGLDRLSLLGHSAGANIVLRYTERHPDRVERILLVTPSTRAVGIEITPDARAAIARTRADEPWYATASAALARIQSGHGTEADWDAITPFSYGRWDDAARTYNARMEETKNPDAIAGFHAAGAFDPAATKAVLSTHPAPVTVLAGSADVGNPFVAMEELTRLFPLGELVIQEGAGHFPWRDDAETFVSLVAPSLPVAR